MDIPLIDWFEEPIKHSVQSVFSGVNEHVESLDIFNRYRKIHFEMLRQQVSGVKILGMQQPMDLKDLYFPACISTDIRRRIYDPEWGTINGAIESSSNVATSVPTDGTSLASMIGSSHTSSTVGLKKGKKKPRLESCEQADGYIAKTNRVVVLGGPGAGKTTFLKFLALAYSDKEIFKKTKLKESYLPIYVHLPLLAKEGKGVVSHISAPLVSRVDLHATAFYTRIFEKGLATIFMDSLDEVPGEFKADLIQELQNFARTYPSTRIVISCRTADYDQVFQDFSEVELTRLSKEAVTSIVSAWFGKQNQQRAAKLLSLLEHDEAVASLTETPLLLSLLCIQFRNDLALPKRKTELYRRCVDALLRDWDTTRGFRRDTAYSQLSDDRKEKIFEALAGKACDDSVDYEFHEAFVLGSISNEIERFSLDPNDAKGILLEIESHHGIVEKCSAETYEFSHGTMQEYFAAKYFVAKRKELDVLKKYYENESWHDIILFMVSMLDDSAPMLEFLVAKSSMERFQNYPAFGRRLAHLLLLYRCMSMGVNISPALRIQICGHLVQSQIDMTQQLNADGVLPFAIRKSSGVRQALFTYKKTRSSLNKILRPYRSLMNEIVLSPIREYAEEIVESIRRIENQPPSSNIYNKIGIMTCLLAPISDQKPDFFLEKMLNCSAVLLENKAESLKAVIVESISTHRVMHPESFEGEIQIIQ